MSAVPMSPRRRAGAEAGAEADASFGVGRRLHSAYALRAQGLRVLLGCLSVIAGFLVFDSTAGVQNTEPHPTERAAAAPLGAHRCPYRAFRARSGRCGRAEQGALRLRGAFAGVPGVRPAVSPLLMRERRGPTLTHTPSAFALVRVASAALSQCAHSPLALPGADRAGHSGLQVRHPPSARLLGCYRLLCGRILAGAHVR